MESEDFDLVPQICNLCPQLVLTVLVKDLPIVVVLALHLDGLLEHLLLLFLQEGLVGLKQHVPIAMVLRLNLHDVPILIEDVLSRYLKERALLSVDSLLSSHHLPPGALGEV